MVTPTVEEFVQSAPELLSQFQSVEALEHIDYRVYCDAATGEL
jgi:hypothetical protein